MKKSLTLVKKEFLDHFNSSQFYILTIGFLILTGWFFTSRLFLDNLSTVKPVFSVIPFIIMVFIPLLTMGTFAYEKESGTMELILTMPFNDSELIIGKFVGNILIFLLIIATTIIYPITIWLIGTPDMGQIVASYFGVMLLGMAFISAGLFASSLTNNQITSFIISFVILVCSIFINSIGIFFPGPIQRVFEKISINPHYYSMINGLIDSGDIIYFLSYTAIFLFLLKINLESRKW